MLAHPENFMQLISTPKMNNQSPLASFEKLGRAKREETVESAQVSAEKRYKRRRKTLTKLQNQNQHAQVEQQHLAPEKRKTSHHALSAQNLHDLSGHGAKQDMSTHENSRNEAQVTGLNRAGITYNSGRLWISQCPDKEESSNTAMNRGLRDRDTFIKIFPGYRLAKDTRRSVMRKTFLEPAQRREGKAIYQEEKVFARKMDPIKKFTEEYIGKLIPSLFTKTIGTNKKVK